ncbi:hypothetical protein ONZ51_g13600 [Trametes cubensis]|uniref:Uncharacterized protein n=1 Tax=Trametes cubensis TaxID=1111947 RepID=A0AAD7TDX1_9APHY|nr:hypothetical protein ONZ51_g13600 [Trametes cubensis]
MPVTGASGSQGPETSDAVAAGFALAEAAFEHASKATGRGCKGGKKHKEAYNDAYAEHTNEPAPQRKPGRPPKILLGQA